MRDAGAPLMFGLRVCVLPGGSATLRVNHGDAERGGLKLQPAQILDSDSHCICMVSGARAQVAITKIAVN